MRDGIHPEPTISVRLTESQAEWLLLILGNVVDELHAETPTFGDHGNVHRAAVLVEIRNTVHLELQGVTQ